MPESKARLVVIDDEPPLIEIVGQLARPLGFEVFAFQDGHEALGDLSRLNPDLALVDPRMRTVGGLSVLREFKRRAPICEVVLMTGGATIDGAVEAVKLGAAGYIAKPPDLERLETLLRTIRVEVARRRQLEEIEQDLLENARFEGMVGRSPAMLELFSLVRRIAPHYTAALVTGETGSGKELVARALHVLSPRRDRAFIIVNCSAAEEMPFEGDLGRANGGTLFLKEVGELPPAMQIKLLGVLDDERATGVGWGEPPRLDMRVIAATHRPLERDVQTGRFRRDLYYRLGVVDLRVPPLRDRREDIPLLVRAFIDEYSRQFGKTIRGATPGAERRLVHHDWPANVRELRNTLERACLLAAGEFIDDGDIILKPVTPDAGPAAAFPGGPVRPIADLERAEIVRALEETRGNKNQAARRLGISRRALYRRLEKFGLATAAADSVVRPPA
jgi:DNA-binding NtrC family response regulator